MIKLASWNVNSLKVRQDQVLAWLESSNTTVIGLQETKLQDENFPQAAFLDKGYHVVYSGQKTYNGVAIISRLPISDVLTDIPDWSDPERRILVATIDGIRVINLYVPNGQAVDTDKYVYKLNWLNAVTTFIAGQLARYPHLVVMGDFNIAPADIDVHDPAAWEGHVLVSSSERQAFEKLLCTGLHDGFRQTHPAMQAFSWWDYRAAAFRRNMGLRIDHILLSSSLTCINTGIDKEPRKSERPSDHTPVWVELSS